LSYEEKKECYKREVEISKRYVDARLQREKRELEESEIKKLDRLITKTDFYKLIMDKLKGCQND
jgi:hypothetical protein